MLSKAPHAFRRCFCLRVCFFSTKGRTSLLFFNNLKLERVVNFYMYSPMAFKFHEEQNKAPLCHLKWNHVLLCETAEERQADTLGRIHLITAHLRLRRGALSRRPAEKKTNCTISCWGNCVSQQLLLLLLRRFPFCATMDTAVF